MIYLDDTSALKLTTGRWYTPDGVTVDREGIVPDIAVEEPTLSEEQAESYARLLQENRVVTFVNENPAPSASQVTAFIGELAADGIDPGERIVRMMVKRESERRQNVPPAVDTEYDRALIRAIGFLETGR